MIILTSRKFDGRVLMPGLYFCASSKWKAEAVIWSAFAIFWAAFLLSYSTISEVRLILTGALGFLLYGLLTLLLVNNGVLRFFDTGGARALPHVRSLAVSAYGIFTPIAASFVLMLPILMRP